MGELPHDVAWREPGRRWAIGGIVAMLGGFAIALVATSWVSFARTGQVGEVIARGQGENLAHAMIAGLFVIKGRASNADLEPLLADEWPQGLRYLAVLDETGAIEAAAGVSVDPASVALEQPLVETPGTLPMRRFGDRWRTLAPRVGLRPWGAPSPFGLPFGSLPGPPPGQPPPPDPNGPPPPGAAGSPPPLPPPRPRSVFVIEWDPIVAAQLRAESGRALLVGIASSLALLAAAAVLWRWVRHRERFEGRIAHERRLASLGQMSAVLAHEIRNPLASLKGHAQLLVESLDDNDRDRKKAERVVEETVRLERLTQDLLEFVRTGRIDLRACNPATVVAAAVRAVGAEVEVTRTGAPATWRLDPERMEQVLTNLIQNAVQAGAGAPVRASITTERGRLVFQIRDLGPGLPGDALETIFEPFHTTRVHGVGLGLAVARRLVELHGGELVARSHPDGGAEFTVQIPES